MFSFYVTSWWWMVQTGRNMSQTENRANVNKWCRFAVFVNVMASRHATDCTQYRASCETSGFPAAPCILELFILSVAVKNSQHRYHNFQNELITCSLFNYTRHSYVVSIIISYTVSSCIIEPCALVHKRAMYMLWIIEDHKFINSESKSVLSGGAKPL